MVAKNGKAPGGDTRGLGAEPGNGFASNTRQDHFTPNGDSGQAAETLPLGTVVPYRPYLNKITGNKEASILLQQLVYWWDKMGRKPFYKYLRPVTRTENDPLPLPAGYRENDTLQVELGFSRRDLYRAMARIARRIKKGSSKTEALKTAMVLYWIRPGNKTLFEINEALILQKMMDTYPGMRELMYESYITNGVFGLLKCTERTLVNHDSYISNAQNVHPIESVDYQETKEKTTTRLEGESPPPRKKSSSGRFSSALDVYQSVTKIKDADKIPEVVISWLSQLDNCLTDDCFTEALRTAIRKADHDKGIFDTDTLEENFARCLPRVKTVYWYLNREDLEISHVSLSNGDEVGYTELPRPLKQDAIGLARVGLARQQAQAD